MGRNAVSTLRLASLNSLIHNTKLTQMILRQSVEGRLVFALAAVAAHGGRRCSPFVEEKNTSRYTGVGIFCLVGRLLCTATISADRNREMLSGLPTAGYCWSAERLRESECACIIQGWLQPTGVPRHEGRRTRPRRPIPALYNADPFLQPRTQRGKTASIWIRTHSHRAIRTVIRESRRAQ